MKLGIITLVFLLATMLTFSTALADTVGTTVTITNAAPTVGSVSATDPVTLSESSTVTVQCTATVTDTNGYGDVSSVNATLWGPSSTEGGSDDYNEHYSNSSCALSGGSGTTINAECDFSVRWSAESGEWTCKLRAVDGSSAEGTASNTAVTVNSLIALSAPSTMTFPETALGGTATEQTTTVTNTGNTQIDTQLYTYGSSDDDGYSAVCTIGGSEISYTALKYNLTASQAYGSMSTIGQNSTVPVTDTAFNLAKDSNATASTKDIYWKTQLPSTDVGGTCTGTLGIVATSG